MRRIGGGGDDTTSNSRVASLKPFLLDNGSVRNGSIKDDSASLTSVPFTSRTKIIMNVLKTRKAAQKSNDAKGMPDVSGQDFTSEKDK